MKNKEIMYAVGGLIVGFLIGAIVVGAGENGGLFGTAADSSNNANVEIEIQPDEFYQINFSEISDWLEEVDPEAKEELSNEIEQVSGLVTASDLAQYYADSEEAIETVLISLHKTLLEEEGIEDTAGYATCLALDRDPYSPTGQGLYLYLEVPANAEDVPEAFNVLDGPREENMLFSKQCYSGDEDET